MEEDVVDASAYLSHINPAIASQYEDILLNRITPLLSERAELMANSESPSSLEHCNIVFVWNIDSIAMLSWKHMREIEYLKPNIDSMSLCTLMDRTSTSLGFANEEEIEAEKVTNILDVLNDKQVYMDSTASKFFALKKLYEEVSGGMKKKEEIISHELLEKLAMLDEEDELCQTAIKVQKIHHQRWKTVKKCLDLVNRRSAKSKNKKYTNVVITNEEVANASIQLMVSRLSSSIGIDKIYSTLNTSEEDVWRRIQKRFGENCVLIYVTTPDPHSFPEEVDVSVWPVNANETITLLYKAQRDHLLK